MLLHTVVFIVVIRKVTKAENIERLPDVISHSLF